MPAGSIVIDLLMRTGSFVTDTDRAAKKLKELEKFVASTAKTFAASFGAAGAAVLYFGKQVIDGLDALNDVADATGASIENISALEDVALRTGATLSDVSSILVRFNGVLKEADGKNGVSLALQEIGLDVEKLKKLDPAEALRQTAVELARYEDNANKARIVQEMFGKGVQQLAPLLKDLGEQGSLVATVTAEQAAEAEQFNKQLSALSKNAKDLARDLAGPLVKEINEVTAAYKRGREAGKGFFEIALERDIRSFKERWGFSQPEGGATGEWGTPEPAPKPQLPDLTEEIEAQKKREEAAKKAAAAAQAEQKQREAAFASYLDGLNKQLERTEELTSVEQVLKDIQMGRITVTSDAQQQTLVGVAQEIDARKALAAELKSQEESAQRLREAQKQIASEVARIYEETRTPIEQFTARQERLGVLLENNHIDVELYGRAMAKARKELDESTKAIDKMSEASKRAEQNIQDALGDTLEDALTGNFDDIGRAWLSMLNKMITQALAADLIDKVMGRGSGTSNTEALWKGIGAIFGATSSSSSGFGTGSAYGNMDYGAFLATGTNYVPYDNFPAILHEGEAVVPKKYNPSANGGSGLGNRYDFSGATYNVGEGVSRGEMMAAVNAGNAQVMARIDRSSKQRFGA